MLEAEWGVFLLEASEWDLFLLLIDFENGANLDIECGGGPILVLGVGIKLYVQFNVAVGLDLVAQQGGIQNLYVFIVLD